VRNWLISFGAVVGTGAPIVASLDLASLPVGILLVGVALVMAPLGRYLLLPRHDPARKRRPSGYELSASVLGVIAVAVGVLGLVPQSPSEGTLLIGDTYARRIESEINDYRRLNGKPTLRPSAILGQSAKKQAIDLASGQDIKDTLNSGDVLPLPNVGYGVVVIVTGRDDCGEPNAAKALNAMTAGGKYKSIILGRSSYMGAAVVRTVPCEYTVWEVLLRNAPK
jgi:hypothetical protein